MRAGRELRDHTPRAAPIAPASGPQRCGWLAARMPNVADGEVSVRSIVTLLDALHAMEPVAAERRVRTRFAQREAVLVELRWLRTEGR